METITFYSYKGGSGRTLAVANAARYLARFGQKVVALDFDIEAPGLHYKFLLEQSESLSSIDKGVLDYVHLFATEGCIPDSLDDYVVQVPVSSESTGSIIMMPAGRVPLAEYWQKLAQINWHDLLFAPGARGVEFFLEFKERIREAYNPDFLLIDSRTGITELGGVATTVLPDKLICLLSSSRENLEGARAILRGIRRAPRLPNMDPVDVLPVLSRVPPLAEDEERKLIDSTLAFLNEEAPSLDDSLSLSDLFLLHSEPDLQVRERLRIGGEKDVEDSTLLVDYLCLFARVVRPEVLEPIIESEVRRGKLRAFENPEDAERQMCILARRLQHPAAYRALLQLYCLRNADPKRIFKTAQLLWRVSKKADDPALWQAVQQTFPSLYRETDVPEPGEVRFVDAVWRGNGSCDVEIGLLIVGHYRSLQDCTSAADVLFALLDHAPPNAKLLGESFAELVDTRRWQDCLDLVRKHWDIVKADLRILDKVMRLGLDHAMEEQVLGWMSPDQIRILFWAAPLDAARLLEEADQASLAVELLLKTLAGALRERPVSVRRVSDLGIALKMRGALPPNFEKDVNRLPEQKRSQVILARVRPSK